MKLIVEEMIIDKSIVLSFVFYANFLDIYDLADKIKEKLEIEVADLYQNDNNYTNYNFLKLIKYVNIYSFQRVKMAPYPKS